MKKQLLAVLCLALASGFVACKKEDQNSVRAKVLGKWQVNKIETTTGGTTRTANYGGSDYMDFKNNDNDDVELSLNNQKTVGRFSTGIGNQVFLDFTDNNKDLQGDIITLDDKTLTFKGEEGNANPKVIKTYYLVR